MLDFLHDLRTRPSRETGQPIGESTVFNYFLKTMVFLNDRGIGKYMAREDWVQKKDWPVNVDKRNKNKKYATYTEQEVAAMIQVADSVEEALTRFLVGTGFRIGKSAVAEWMDINWEDKTVSVRFKPKFGFIEIWADFTCTISALYVQVDYFRARRHAEVEVSPRIGKG
jgi:integrase